MKDVKITKYWRTEPLDKDIDPTSSVADCLWSGYHPSEEDAINYILKRFDEYGFDFSGVEFEVLPYYVIEND